MKRYTLLYTAPLGRPIVLFNLAKSAVDEITRVQTNLGSSGFASLEQPHNYSQEEIDLLKGK